MAKKVDYFDSVKVEIPRKGIYTRLGYRADKTHISSQQEELVEGYIEQAVSLLSLKAAYLRIPIRENDTLKVTLENGEVFESSNLAKMLYDCDEVLLMAATGGSEIVDSIRKNSLGGDVTQAVVFDATASETVDATLDWLMEYVNRDMRRENKRLLKRRFSAGYGDLQLANQKLIYDILDLKQIGILIGKNFILSPEKSVTAITGVVTFN
ncbi:methionine synthase [Thermoproteota archaeon]